MTPSDAPAPGALGPNVASGEAHEPDEDSRFIPALRFHILTPMFDLVAAIAARDRTLKRRVLAHAGIGPGMDILDIGCGTGTLALGAARACPGLRVTGLDADPSILVRARRRAVRSGVGIRFDQGMATELPYEIHSFDVVFATLLFHHLSDDAKGKTAAEMVRVLRPGGRVVVADVGRPQDLMMRLAVRGTVQMLDGVETTALNVRGGLPSLLAAAGLQQVTVVDRLRTPAGTHEVMTATVLEVTNSGPIR